MKICKRALNNLKKANINAKTTTSRLNVETTHLYVRFLPKNEEELSILKRDSTLVLYDYPLDYEIEEKGYFYRDPEVPDGQPTYQYCAIKVNKELPSSIENEILAELFIPNEDNDDKTISKKAFSYDIVNTLVDEALRITNNLPNIDFQSQKSLFRRRSKWRPAGTIRVWDDNLSRWVGVEGVEVRARRWFTTHKGIANSSGYYSCDGRFRRDANYSIDWERYHFALQDGWLNGATYTGVVVDMIDPIGGTDQVTGYTIRQIEDALNGKTTWNSWRDNIINTIENDKEENLATLFDRWDF